MQTLKEYLLFEVSKTTAGRAKRLAIEDIQKLTNEFAASKFKDMDILAKLQKRANQVDVFDKYVNDINTQTAEVFSNQVKSVIEKWNDGRKLANGATFRPLFVLSSGEDWIWGKKYDRTGKEVWNKPEEEREELKLSYLTVLALLNDKYSYNMEYYHINEELKEDLSKIKGLSFYTEKANRRNKKAPYNTTVMWFQIDKRLIDSDKMSELLPGITYTNTSSTKIDRGWGSDIRGDYRSIYKTREATRNLN